MNKITKKISFKNIYLLLTLPLIVIVLLVYSCGKSEESYKLTYKTLTEAVYASGNIIPKDEYKVFALVEGYISRKLVKEGDKVTEGQALFLIENDQQNIRQSNAGDIYAMAQSNFQEDSPVLRELQSALETAKTKMQNDSINYYRYKNLIENEATSQSEYDRVSLSYKTSKNEYLLQKSRYEKTRNQLWIEMRNAESQLQINSKINSDYAVKSRINGMVYETYKEEGEAVRRNDAVALVGANNQVYLKLAVDELDINKIKIGQEVLVKIDVYKGKVFKAKISKIYKMLDKLDQSFRVDAEFAEDYPASFSGLTVEANIIIHHKEKALVIPKSLLIGEDSLMIKKDNKKQKIKIKKGIENYDWVEVIGGLKAEKEIIISQ